jgi:hypothetical protein
MRLPVRAKMALQTAAFCEAPTERQNETGMCVFNAHSTLELAIA